ncbi:uncharacterized protein CMC5_064270 [Chondromyces crocatus]|uniref:DNA 3'-5' helicase n=1 Tax=Chondromyces crocatus TaxID=52 RepID=A0A0K1EMY4_CHOCO|nr:uncharacterized protein CMC5_064270 [Chondromyces crocatus]
MLVEGGAGTGKTTLLAARIVALLAPEERERAPALTLEQVAVLCSTPEAATRLRARVREQLLDALDGVERDDMLEEEITGPGGARATRLRAALAGLGTTPAWTLTHLSEQLLREWPLETGIGPADLLVEDPTALAHETFCELLDGAQNGTLAASLGAKPVSATTSTEHRGPHDLPMSLAAEAEQTVQEALLLGIHARKHVGGQRDQLTLEDLVTGFLLERHTRPRLELPVFDRERFRRGVDGLMTLTESLGVASPGAAWIQGCAWLADAMRDKVDPLTILRTLGPALGALRDRPYRKAFDGDPGAWEAWRRLSEGSGRPDEPPLLFELLGPAEEQFAARLSRLEPVVLALHERVKRRLRVLDRRDVLFKLRALLTSNVAARAEFQSRIRHLVVDDAQTLDPLEAEIVLHLAGDGMAAWTPPSARFGEGRVTLALDPLSFSGGSSPEDTPGEMLRERALEAGALRVQLTTSYRATPPLTRWLARRLPALLGVSSSSDEGPTLPLLTPRPMEEERAGEPPGTRHPSVHLLPLALPAGAPSAEATWKALEARTLAAHLRWLVEESGLRIDAEEGRHRAVRYGDIAVIALNGEHLGALFTALDHQAVPHAAADGPLALEDPLLRRFLLGLRALADQDDGAAMATLLRPPFFALTLEDLWRHRAGDAQDPAAARVAVALDLVTALRKRRLERSPGATARDLLEQTAFGRTTALGPNGEARLARLRALCFALGERAAREGLDYDTATAGLHGWLERPPPLGALGTGLEHVRVLMAQQAGDLEIPVVVLWDALFARTRDASPPLPRRAWWVDPRTEEWAVWLSAEGGWQLRWGSQVLSRARDEQLREHRWQIYRIITRARRLLVLPHPESATHDAGWLEALLRVDDQERGATRSTDQEDVDAPWAPTRDITRALTELSSPPLRAGVQLGARSAPHRGPPPLEVPRPRAQRSPLRSEEPEGDTLMPISPGDPAEPLPRTTRGAPRVSRFDPPFAATVQRALSLLLRGALSLEAALHMAARETGLQRRLGEATRDVGRARTALRAEGLWERAGITLHTDYPIAGSESGTLVHGSIDLVAVSATRLDLLEIRTEQPIRSASELERAAQHLVACARLLETTTRGTGRRLRCGLLFTAEGRVWWL